MLPIAAVRTQSGMQRAKQAYRCDADHPFRTSAALANGKRVVKYHSTIPD
jgi:hypothetical protein